MSAENPTRDSARLDQLAQLHLIGGVFASGVGLIGTVLFCILLISISTVSMDSFSAAQDVFANFIIYLAMIAFSLILALMGAALLLSAKYIRARKKRVLSLIVSGLLLLFFPLGTLLGFFSLWVLASPQIRAQHRE